MLRLLVIMFSFVVLFQGSKAFANESEFFKSVEGKWSGPGEIVAGKYKGTKFTCVFSGDNPIKNVGMKIDGYCRVGVFAQPMNAIIEKASRGYHGKFLDGEAGEGMDIIGGRYSSNKLVVNIKRKDLRGVLVASKANENHMQMTISVRVDGKLVPVIGMRLDRTDGPNLAKRG
ncbi:MAG: hypothetical protein WBC71_08875 [Salaquimonas sp.]